MGFVLETEGFCLKLELQVFENDIGYPTNAIMDVEVVSGGFSGKAAMDIDIVKFAGFAADLHDIYTSLKGDAKIEEPFGAGMYIFARGDGRGHIEWRGMLCCMGQKLEFENEVDQTCLRDFSSGLKQAYERYLPAE